MLRILNNSAVRTIFYLGFIGGLLVLSAYLFELAWNRLLAHTFNLKDLTTLESVGLIALGYVALMAIRFGFENDSLSHTGLSKFPIADKNASNISVKNPIRQKNDNDA